MALRYNVATAVTAMIMLCSSSAFAGEIDSNDLSERLFQSKRPEVSSELRVREKYQYYEVDGANVTQLRKQMKQNGTKWDDGKVYAALTSWDIRYSFDVFWEDGKCSVKSVKTDVEITYQLPRRVSLMIDPALKLQWDEYVLRLKEHEYGHKDLAVQAAAEINQVLASLENFSTREELEQEARRRTGEKLREMKELQVVYDDETRHGETQGAILLDRHQHNPGEGSTLVAEQR